MRQRRELYDLLARLGLPFLVAEAEGRVAGYAYATPWRQKPAYRHTVEDSIFVAPGMTGRGAGRGRARAASGSVTLGNAPGGRT